MGRVRIVTDSAAELSPEVAERWDISVVPLDIWFGEEVLRDGIEITSPEYYRKLRRTSLMPFSSAPPPEAFQRVYARLAGTAEEIISIHTSSKLSGVLEVAEQASQPLLGRCRIAVFDSFLTSVGLGLLVRSAAEAAEEGATIDEIIRLLRGMIPYIYIVFFADTLDYLERGKHLTRPQTLLGTMLNIKPLFIIEEGEIQPLEKVRNRARALERLSEFITEFSRIEKLILLYSTNQREIDELRERIDLIIPDLDITTEAYGPFLATHIGPGAVGAMVYEGGR